MIQTPQVTPVVSMLLNIETYVNRSLTDVCRKFTMWKAGQGLFRRSGAYYSITMTFSGFQKLDLINFPGYMACTVYTAGCNLRCPYCHNPGLATGGTEETYTLQEVLSYIEKRKGMLEAVVVSGGEPTLHLANPDSGESREFEAFLSRVRELGLLVKLDTNGCRPDVVERLINLGLIDYVALDIKAPLDEEGYSRVKPLIPPAQAALNIKKTLDLLRAWASEKGAGNGAENRAENGTQNWEVRTTYLSYLLSKEDILRMVEQAGPVPRWYIQAFNPAVTLDGSWADLSAPENAECEQIAALMREKGVNAFVR